MNISNKNRWQLKIQSWTSLLCFPLLFPLIIIWLKFIQKYRIENLQALRRQFSEIKNQHPNGLLICPNHLTFLDSIVLIWAFSNPLNYLVNFRTMCWNLPKASHVKESRLYRVVCYLGKCLLITNDAKQSQHSMEQASYLLNSGQYVMVFPEGTRSNTGRINTENFIYGVGKLHLDGDSKDLLCVYLRGKNQQSSSKMPAKHEQFYIQMELITITTTMTGRRAMRDVSTQMIEQLVKMEEHYLSQQV
jgi:hypothetical protein